MSAEPSAPTPVIAERALAQDLYDAAHKFDRDGAVEFIGLYLRLYRQQLEQGQLELQLRRRARKRQRSPAP
jgi:hypothetical protein